MKKLLKGLIITLFILIAISLSLKHNPLGYYMASLWAAYVSIKVSEI